MRKYYVVHIDNVAIPFRDEDTALRYVAKNGGVIILEWR
jgi:nitrous oxide reductase accessory protein NosL